MSAGLSYQSFFKVILSLNHIITFNKAETFCISAGTLLMLSNSELNVTHSCYQWYHVQ